MGVPGGFSLIKHAEEITSLRALTIAQGFLNPERKTCRYRLGIDISTQIVEITKAFHSCGTQAGASPELRTMFYRLARLSRLAISVVFIFDGPGRPSLKRETEVLTKPHWLSEELKVMINAFGFSWYMAPGEAEAELAAANRLGLIDAVLTTDFDALMFGAETVITMIKAGEICDEIRVHRAKTLLADETLHLTRGGLVLIAILSGGDYSPGIKGCGIKTAHALARCGYGDTLLTQLGGTQAAHRWMPRWINEIKSELCTNAQGFLAKRDPSLAGRLHEEFPDIKTVRLYAQPLVTRPSALLRLKLPSNLPNVPQLVAFCRQLFTFGQEVRDLQETFRKNMWSSLCHQLVIAEAVRTTELVQNHGTIGEYDNLGFSEINLKPLPLHIIRENNLGLVDAYYTVRVSGVGVHDLIGKIFDDAPRIRPVPLYKSLIKELQASKPVRPLTSQVTIKMPSAMLERAFPDLVASYEARATKKHSQKLKATTKPLEVVRRRHAKKQHTPSVPASTTASSNSSTGAQSDRLKTIFKAINVERDVIDLTDHLNEELSNDDEDLSIKDDELVVEDAESVVGDDESGVIEISDNE